MNIWKEFHFLMRPETFVHVIYVRKKKKTNFFKSNQILPKEINAMNILRKLTFNCLFFFFFFSHPKLKLEGFYFDVSVFCHHMYNFKMELEEFCTFFDLSFDMSPSLFFPSFFWPFFFHRERKRKSERERE